MLDLAIVPMVLIAEEVLNRNWLEDGSASKPASEETRSDGYT